MPAKSLFLVAVLFLLGPSAPAANFISDWPESAQRVWIGPQYWSNPLQDWRLDHGRLECATSGGDRNVFLLTRELSPDKAAFLTEIRFGPLDAEAGSAGQGWVGFKIGLRGDFDDYRDTAVRGKGLSAGLAMDGRLFIAGLEDKTAPAPPVKDACLRLEALPEGEAYTLRLTLLGVDGETLSKLTRKNVDPRSLFGGLALACSSASPEAPPPVKAGPVLIRDWGADPSQSRGGDVRFWFSHWKVSGEKVAAKPERAFGPILFAQYTLDHETLKITAQLPPLGIDAGPVRLQVEKGDDWITVAEAAVDAMASTATFRASPWDVSRDTPYRLCHALDGRTYQYEGLIRKDPADKESIVVAAFTGNHDFGFPAKDVAAHAAFFDPDLLVFTGDQIYEPCGGYGIEREPLDRAVLDYLRKWFIFGWAFRDLFRDRPSVCLPDDHDVYQGNIWGAGGRHASPPGMKGQDQGGYVMPAEWVNAVHRTQTSHLPDPFDPTPIDQGITVYYTSLTVGGVSFALVADRMWKSPPAVVIEGAKIQNGWALNPDYDAAKDGDVEGAVLLEKRQLDFLETWATDFRGGVWMKCLLSQTLFANLATLPADARSDGVTHNLKIMAPGAYAQGERIVQDHDSNGWPQSGRNRALRVLRKGFAFHIAGDQHLGSLIQYGVDDWRDASFALCVPSVANIFPRRWFPPGGVYTGDFLDGFGNRMTVHAVSNPHANGIEPTALNHRAPGYGIVRFDRATRKITAANWPRWVDPSKPGARPYPGWPVVVDQEENYGKKAAAYLPTLNFRGIEDPVVQVIDEGDGAVVYTLRIRGDSFQPKVFKEGTYTVRAGEPGTERMKVLEGIKASEDQGRAIDVLFEDD